MSEETKEVVTKPEREIMPQPEMNYPALFELAMSNEKGLEIIKELTDLKNKEEDRNAKKEFDIHFAEMQAEFTPIVRSKKGAFGMYAPLEEMTKKYGPILADHGISYRWVPDKEMIVRGDKLLKRTYIVFSGYGHDRKETFFDAPEIEKRGGTNALQDEGKKDTYSHRYTFKAGLGIAEIGEDVDGTLSFDDGLKYGDLKLTLDECKTLDELQKQSQVFYSEFKKSNDDAGIEVLRKLKIKRKEELS